MVFSGDIATILAGYRVAARLAKWRADTSEGGMNSFTVEAKIIERDEFWMRYNPKHLEVTLGSRRLRWPVSAIREGKTKMVLTVEGQWRDSLLNQKLSGSSSTSVKVGSKSKKS